MTCDLGEYFDPRERQLPDGRVMLLQALLFNRARIHLLTNYAGVILGFTDDAW